jgi:uncharacterized delta-60 repeat protein
MGKKRLVAYLVMIAVYHGSMVRGLAATGELEVAFGDNGLVRISAAPAEGGVVSDDRAVGVWAQPDGKLLVGLGGSVNDFSILRLNVDGAGDLEFNGTGRTSLAVEDIRAEPYAVIQQSDGKIIAAGTSTGDDGVTYDVALARFLADGRPDTSFGGQGMSQAGLSVADAAVAVVQQADGKLVAAASVIEDAACAGCWDYKSGPDFQGTFDQKLGVDVESLGIVLVRFDQVGNRDASFGNNGQVIVGSSSRAVLRSLTQQADGKLVAVGFSRPDMAVIRLDADGGLDATFDGDGFTMVSVGSADAAIFGEAVAVQRDGRIVVGGTIFPCDPSDPICEGMADAAIARLNSDGSLDTSFGSGGIAAFDVKGWDRTELSTAGLVIETDGTIVVAGRTSQSGNAAYFFVARLTPGGLLDPEFGDGGVTLIDNGFAWWTEQPIAGMARMADGSIAVAMSDIYYDDPWGYAGDWSELVVARLAPFGGHPGIIGLTANAVMAVEGANAQLGVLRTGGTRGTVSVNYATQRSDCVGCASDADFEASAGTLTWTDGDTGERTITVPIATDLVLDDGESFEVRLSDAVGGAGLASRYGRVSVIDAARANPGILHIDNATATEEQGAITLFVRREEGRAGAISVRYSTIGVTATADLDFAPDSGILRWADGDYGMRIISIAIAADGIPETAETFQVLLSAPSGGAILGADVATATIAGHLPERSSTFGGGGVSGILDLWLLGSLLIWSRRRRKSR